MSGNFGIVRFESFHKIVFLTGIVLLTVAAINGQVFGDRNRAGGTGGIHSIQGRIIFPSNNAASNLRIRLESANTATLTTFSNSEGIFRFSGLEPSNYTIIVETGDDYLPIRESVFIDLESSSTLAQTFNLVFYMRPKNSPSVQNTVINASFADVPKPALEQYKKAAEAIEKKDFKSAIIKLNEAIRLYPRFAEAYSQLGALYLKNGELKAAEEMLRKTLQINEKNPSAQLNYGVVLLNQKKMFEAEKELEKAVLADENAVAPHIYLGIALLGLEYPDYAEKEFLKAVSLSKDARAAQAHRYLGGIYWKKGNYKLAVEHLENYLQLDPKAPDSEKVLATIKDLQSKSK